MADDDRDTRAERARLEGIAWGAGSTPAEAARARIALADLRRRGPAATPAVTSVGAPAASPSDPPADPRGPSAVSPAAEPAPAPSVGRSGVPDHGLEARGGSDARPTDGGAPGLPAGGSPPDATDGSGPTVGRVRDRALRIVRSARARPWVAGGAAAAIVVAFGTGLAVGTVRPALPASPSVTPTPGTITLEQLLDAPQTYADQIPGSVEAPVSLHSTRLVFTNRSLSGDDSATPWNVWAGVGTERSTICLVATANRIEATSACYPREDALHGKVSLTAQSLSGTLIVELNGGGVDGRVAKAF